MELAIGLGALAVVGILIFFSWRKPARADGRAIAESATPPSPPLPPGRAPRVGTESDEQRPKRQRLSGLHAEGATVFIRYVAADGDESERRITVRQIFASGDSDYFLQCYCHERAAPRAFYASRMVEVVDLETGEVFSDARAFFARAAEPPAAADPATARSERAAVRMLQPELAALLFMCRADGRMHAKERAVVARYAVDRAPVLMSHGDWLDAYLRRLYPDGDVFLNALPELSARPEPVRAALCQALDEVVRSDGKTAPGEVEALARFHRALGIAPAA